MEHGSSKVYNYKINLFITSFGIIIITILFLYLPNEVDGWFISKTSFLYGFRYFIISVVCMLLFNVCLFSNELLVLLKRKTKHDKDIFEGKKFSRWKVCLCIISIVFIVFSFLGIGTITIEDEGITVKENLLSQERIIYYNELESRELFIAGNDDVYWGKYTYEDSSYYSIHHEYDVYLGKAQNIHMVIKLINEKTGRELKLV